MYLTDGIPERDLIDNTENNAVQTLKIVQTEDDKFQLHITLTWKEGELYLETQRKTVREWSSLDRLVHHINNYYGSIPLIILQLRNHKHEFEKEKKLVT
jgi:hypothetical protein